MKETRLLPNYSKKWNLIFIFVSVLSLFIPLFFHFRHDYASFTVHWAHLLQGGDPWLFSSGEITGNAYGPLYNVFAYLYGIYSHLPHFIFILTWLALSRFTLNTSAETATEKEKTFLFCFLLLNPFFLATVVSYGHFDIVVALFTVLAVLSVQKSAETKAGVSIGVAILFKLYPLFFIPFLFVGEKKLRWKFLFSTIATVVIGYSIAFLVWGKSVWVPFTYATDRQSTQLSIFRFFRSDLSPTGNLDFLAPYFLVAAVGAWGLIYLFKRKDSFLASIMGFYFTLWFFRVGHFQFYTVLFFLIPLWIAHQRQTKANEPNQAIKRALFAPLMFVSLSVLIYICTQGYKFKWVWIDETISIPFFIIQCICFATLLKESFRRKT